MGCVTDNYDEVEDGYFNCPFMIYLGDYSHKSYKNLKDKYNLLVCKDDYRYLKLVRISDDYVTYEFPVKKRWFDKIHIEIIFDDIEKFKKNIVINIWILNIHLRQRFFIVLLIHGKMGNLLRLHFKGAIYIWI